MLASIPSRQADRDIGETANLAHVPAPAYTSQRVACIQHVYGSVIRRILGEDVIKVTPAMQYPHDLSNTISYPIKKHVGAHSNRSEAGSYFIPSTSGKRVIFLLAQCVVDFTDNFVGPLPAGTPGVVVPDFGEIGARLRRPDDRSPTIRHPARAVG